MPVALALIAVGFALVYQALTGKSLAQVMGGGLDKLDPRGGRGGSGGGPVPGPDVTGNTDPKGEFKGPNAALLRRLAVAAVQDFNLKITEICRPQNATYGADKSLHKECRAFDASGAVSDKVAFARYAAGFKPAVSEVFCDQAGMVAPGYDHSDHVHVGA